MAIYGVKILKCPHTCQKDLLTGDTVAVNGWPLIGPNVCLNALICGYDTADI